MKLCLLKLPKSKGTSQDLQRSVTYFKQEIRFGYTKSIYMPLATTPATVTHVKLQIIQHIIKHNSIQIRLKKIFLIETDIAEPSQQKHSFQNKCMPFKSNKQSFEVLLSRRWKNSSVSVT